MTTIKMPVNEDDVSTLEAYMSSILECNRNYMVMKVKYSLWKYFYLNYNILVDKE
jgi:hypothetical protein